MSFDRFLIAFETLAAQSVRLVDHIIKLDSANFNAGKPSVEDPKPAAKADTPKKAETPKAVDSAAKTDTPKKADAPKKTEPPKAVDPAALTDDTANADGFKYGKLKAAVIAHGAEHGAPATMAILQDFGVSHAKNIDPALWQSAYERFTGGEPESEEDFA